MNELCTELKEVELIALSVKVLRGQCYDGHKLR